MVLIPAKGTFFCFVCFCWQVGGLHTVGDSGAFHLGAQFLKIWYKKSQDVYIISSQGGECLSTNIHLCSSHVCSWEKMVNQSVSPPGNVQLSSQGHFVKLALVCLGVWLYHSSFPRTNLEWVGVCVPTERHGQVFRDMGFMVHEYSFWNSNKLCIDPNLIFSVVEVQRSPAQNLVPQLGLWFYFPFFYPLETSKIFSRHRFAGFKSERT